MRVFPIPSSKSIWLYPYTLLSVFQISFAIYMCSHTMDLISQIIPICFRTPPEKSAPAYHNNPLDTMFLSLQFRFEEKKKYIFQFSGFSTCLFISILTKKNCLSKTSIKSNKYGASENKTFASGICFAFLRQTCFLCFTTYISRIGNYWCMEIPAVLTDSKIFYS